jgi:ABC-type polysaccharide/polyol phosphate transport system ATPase subunit
LRAKSADRSGNGTEASGRLIPGQIVLDHATRSFSIRADNAGTLKGLILRTNTHGPSPVPALQDVTLTIAPGETVGMVGRNGAGKTSTLRVLAGIVPLQQGRAECGGRVVSLLELAAGFSRDFSGRENIYLQGALFGFDRPAIEARLEEIIAFSELGDFIEVPVKTYSQGMFLRLGFSIAAHLDADVLLIDEVLAVGDEGFQRKCLRRISEQIAGGATLVLVSHDLSAIERVCERVIVIDRGKVVFDGATAEGLHHYRVLVGTEHGGGESTRPHRSALAVTDLELRDGAGRAASVFHGGAPLTVQVTIRALEPSEHPQLVLELRADTGTPLFRTVEPFELGADGTATIAFEVPDLALLGGDYDIAVGAGPAGSILLGLERTSRFAVAREPSGAEGIIDLRGTWHAAERVP